MTILEYWYIFSPSYQTGDKEGGEGLGDVCMTFWTLRSLGKGKETPTLSFCDCGMSSRSGGFTLNPDWEASVDDVKDVGLSLFQRDKFCYWLGKQSLVFVSFSCGDSWNFPCFPGTHQQWKNRETNYQISHFLVILGRIRYYKEEQEEVKAHCWNSIRRRLLAASARTWQRTPKKKKFVPKRPSRVRQNSCWWDFPCVTPQQYQNLLYIQFCQH